MGFRDTHFTLKSKWFNNLFCPNYKDDIEFQNLCLILWFFFFNMIFIGKENIFVAFVIFHTKFSHEFLENLFLLGCKIQLTAFSYHSNNMITVFTSCARQIKLLNSKVQNQLYKFPRVFSTIALVNRDISCQRVDQ